MRWQYHVFAAAIAAISGPALSANAYKCKAADGSITFQDRPCAAEAAEVDRQTFAKEPDAPHTQYVPSRDGPGAPQREPGTALGAPRRSATPVSGGQPGDKGIGAPPSWPADVRRCVTARGRVYVVPHDAACGSSLVAEPSVDHDSRTPTGPVYDMQGRPLDAHWINENQAIDNRTGQVLMPHQIQAPGRRSPPQQVNRVQDQGSVVDRTAICQELRDRYKHLPVNTSKRARDALDDQIAATCVKKSLWQ